MKYVMTTCNIRKALDQLLHVIQHIYIYKCKFITKVTFNYLCVRIHLPFLPVPPPMNREYVLHACSVFH